MKRVSNTGPSDGSEDGQDEPAAQPIVPAKTITTKAVFDRSTTQTISLSDLPTLDSESGTEQEVVPTEAKAEAKETSGFPLKMVAIAVVPLAVAAFAIFGLGGGDKETITTTAAPSETTSTTPTESTAAEPREVTTTAPIDTAPSTTSEAPIALASAETTTSIPETTTSILETTTSILETTTSILETGAPFNCAENQGPVTPQLVVANIPADDPDGGLNIRYGVSVSSEILITSPNGTAFTHLGGCEVVANGDVWWQVTGEDITGWANAKYFTS